MARKKKQAQQEAPSVKPSPQSGSKSSAERQSLEIVLKSDVAGTLEAVRSSIGYINVPDVDIRIIQSGVGSISKSDILMARTGSRLIVGFNVGVTSQLRQQLMENGVEVRLFDVIYKLSSALTELAGKMVPVEPEDKVFGNAEVIAVFKRSKGIIIGCEVRRGVIEKGKRFRVITAMGPAYTGRIDTLQIENKSVKSGRTGQQVGIGISDWKKARVGDLVECFESPHSGGRGGWRPKPGIHYSKS